MSAIPSFSEFCEALSGPDTDGTFFSGFSSILSVIFVSTRVDSIAAFGQCLTNAVPSLVLTTLSRLPQQDLAVALRTVSPLRGRNNYCFWEASPTDAIHGVGKHQ
jgi:hypothetical protein